MAETILAALRAKEVATPDTNKRVKTLERKKQLLILWLFRHWNRISDILRVDWGDLDLPDGINRCISVRAGDPGKAHRRRSVRNAFQRTGSGWPPLSLADERARVPAASYSIGMAKASKRSSEHSTTPTRRARYDIRTRIRTSSAKRWSGGACAGKPACGWSAGGMVGELGPQVIEKIEQAAALRRQRTKLQIFPGY